MNSSGPETSRILAHVAGFHASVAAADEVGLPAAGWGLGQALNYADQYTALRERLRAAEPVLFADLPTTIYGASIASRNTLLRQLVLESHAMLVTAAHLGLCPSPPSLRLAQHRHGPAKRFVKEHTLLIQVAAGVIAGGILYLLNWAR